MRHRRNVGRRKGPSGKVRFTVCPVLGAMSSLQCTYLAARSPRAARLIDQSIDCLCMHKQIYACERRGLPAPGSRLAAPRSQ